MPLLALDDTDTRTGGCTTHTAYRLAHALERADGPLREWGLVEAPRLVRLNPAAKHRTRGNGALVLAIGKRPLERRIRIGTWPDGTPIRVASGPPEEGCWPEPDALNRLMGLVQRHLPEPGEGEADPQPGAVLLPQPPDVELYRLAVSRMVSTADAWTQAPEGTLRLTPGPLRGETGALAAGAWPADRPTSGHPARWSWEYICYRDPSAGDRQARLPTDFTKRLALLEGGFDNLDPLEARVRAVPRTPCPVLFGVRGREPHVLVDAFTGPGFTSTPGWLLLTNHATGDHARYAPSQAGPHQVTRASVRITGRPVRRRGGHLFVPADLRGQAVTLAAYEPTKELRAPLEATRPGDRLRIVARARDDPHLLAVEAFMVEGLVPRERPGGNPRCPECGGATKSRGAGAGFRCPRCRVRLEEATRVRRTLDPGPLRPGELFQVPDHVRGHLLPPLQGLGPSRSLYGASSQTVPPVLETDAQRLVPGAVMGTPA